MKTSVLASIVGMFLSCANASDFSRATSFESVEDFVAKAKGFAPATSGSDLAALFTTPELGQPGDPKTGRPVVAKAIESGENIWSNDSLALVFVKARPPTEATKSVTGVLFLIKRTGDSWQISDSKQFTATGKDAGISVQQTAVTGGGPDRVGEEGSPPVVTITETQGGRGYSYDLSGSYTIEAGKLERLDLR